jgi:hypothetical protein
MLDSLFEGSAFKMLLVRWFGRERPTNAGRRGRRARLAVVEAANVDGRRKLVLIRRDNLEHLVLIGGPSDVLIEPTSRREQLHARCHHSVRCPQATRCGAPCL